ncbi:MAG: OstA-like protein [Chitinivibrionales bacterium]|nr:OstA-like protein [Chitinivibrionales bacterium]
MKKNQFLILLMFLCLALIGFAKPKNGSLILKSADSMDNIMVGGNLISELKGHVVFEYDDAVIHSDYAKWWRSEGMVNFSNHVVLSRPQQTLNADFLHYERDKKLCTANGNLLFIDRDKRLRLTGQQGFYNLQTRYFWVQGNPYLVQRDSTARDSLTIRGTTMTYTDSTKSATVVDNVIIRKGDLNAVGQRAYYFSQRQRANLRVNPHITYKTNTLTGDSVDLIFKQDTLRGVSVKGNSDGRYRENSKGDTLVTTIAGDSMYMSMTDSGAVDSIHVFRDVKGTYYNIRSAAQVNEASGKTMTLSFNKQGNVDRATIWGNAKSTYYVDEQDGSGKTIATGDTIRVSFADGKARRIRLTGSVRGSYIPTVSDTLKSSAPKQAVKPR